MWRLIHNFADAAARAHDLQRIDGALAARFAFGGRHDLVVDHADERVLGRRSHEGILVGRRRRFLGANARYLVNALVARHLSASLPWGTLAVNVTGSFLVGAVLAWTTERVLADPAYRFLVVVGFCGAYTTFSSYAFETVRLIEQGHVWVALGNFVMNNLLAVAGAIAGVAVARWL